VIGAVQLGRTYLTLVLITLGLGYIYTGPPFAWKRYSAGAGIIVLVAGMMTFAAGSSVDGRLHVGIPLVIFAIAMSLWMGAVGAMAKDLSDIRGDALAGRRTCVVMSGAASVRRRVSRNAVLIAVGLALTAAVATPQLRPAAMGLLIGAGALAVCSDQLFSVRAKHPRLPYRAFMATQYGVHLIVVVTAF
jgi:1,4-dihydroxy-2-naphthoate octaprenyltransferase